MLACGVLFGALLSLGTAAEADTTLCKLDFGMRGWSKHFETAVGRGTITCDNGQTTTVAIQGHGATALPDGGGAFASGGTATFSAVLDISALLGSYVLPPAARAGNARPLGIAGAMSNGQATITFPTTGPSSKFPATYGRIGILPHSLSY